jgi:hypothetical protein
MKGVLFDPLNKYLTVFGKNQAAKTIGTSGTLGATGT